MCLALLFGLALPARALAQPASAPPAPAPSPTAETAAPSPEDPRRMAEARSHFEAGSRHYEAREFREAIREFELSAALVPSADLAYNIARCHEQIDEFEAAIEYYRIYLREKIDPPDKAEVDQKIVWLTEQIDARRLAGRTRSQAGLLRLAVTPPGAAITIDGRPAGTSPIPEALTVPPGRHRLFVTAPGRQNFVAVVEVRAGDTTQAVADLPPATVHEAVRGGRLWTWVAGGAAALSAVGGVVLGLEAQSTMDRAQRTYDEGDRAGGRDIARNARRQADNADLLYGGAIVFCVTSVILFFVEGSSIETETRTASAE
jgi:tetratricopeptide (TPR) repeat protein